MFSESTGESFVWCFVCKIEEMSEIYADKPEVVCALKEIGRFALTLFEWTEPDWAKKYHERFREQVVGRIEDPA